MKKVLVFILLWCGVSWGMKDAGSKAEKKIFLYDVYFDYQKGGWFHGWGVGSENQFFNTNPIKHIRFRQGGMRGQGVVQTLLKQWKESPSSRLYCYSEIVNDVTYYLNGLWYCECEGEKCNLFLYESKDSSDVISDWEEWKEGQEGKDNKKQNDAWMQKASVVNSLSYPMKPASYVGCGLTKQGEAAAFIGIPFILGIFVGCKYFSVLDRFASSFATLITRKIGLGK